MARTSEHKINRNLTAQLPKSVSQINSLRQLLALSESSMIDEYLQDNCKELVEYNTSMNEAKELLRSYGVDFISNIPFRDPPDTKNAIECASYFLKFNVTSEKDIRRIFGDNVLKELSEKEGILTYKDNLNPRSSDKKLLLNIALIYCVNVIQSVDNDNSIPFNIFIDIFFPTLPKENNSAFLFNTLESLKNSDIEHSPFSFPFNCLYRAYERYVIPSDELIKLLVKTRKSYSRDTHKYNDKIIQEFNARKEAIETTRWQLMKLIRDNIIYWMEQSEQDIIKQELEEDHQETTTLLNDIIVEFNKRESARTLSSEYFLFALTNMQSSDDINRYIYTVKTLFTLHDEFIFDEFKKIFFHILGEYNCPITPIDIDSVLDHLDRTPISADSIWALADFMYGITEITDEEYLLLDSILDSLSNNREQFAVVHNLLQAYSPIEFS